jgi:hypothetical protein
VWARTLSARGILTQAYVVDVVDMVNISAASDAKRPVIGVVDSQIRGEHKCYYHYLTGRGGPLKVPCTMLEDDEIETVDAEPMLSVDTRLAGLPAELPAHLAAELVELIEDAERYAAAAQALNTTRAYASDWSQFQAWCERYRLESLPASAASLACM